MIINEQLIYQISSGLPIIGEDGMMTTGTGMEFDLPGT